MNNVNEIIKLAIQHPEWLWMEYDIVQHALIKETPGSDDEEGLAVFMVSDDNNYNVDFISVYDYDNNRGTGSEIFKFRLYKNVLQVKSPGTEWSSPSKDMKLFFVIFNEHYKKCCKSFYGI